LKKGENMIKKLLLVSFIAILIFPMTQCAPEDRPYDEFIDLPFIQCTTGYSAASAIAMWAAFDGNYATEEDVLGLILNADGTVNHSKMEHAIWTVTNSTGWVSEFPATDNGQNQALSAIENSLKQNCCSILPLIDGHYVPVFLVHGHKVNGVPKAQTVGFHAYDQPNQSLTVSALKSTFYKPINGKMVAFIGKSKLRPKDWPIITGLFNKVALITVHPEIMCHQMTPLGDKT
jgi:hypothetical protein